MTDAPSGRPDFEPPAGQDPTPPVDPVPVPSPPIDPQAGPPPLGYPQPGQYQGPAASPPAAYPRAQQTRSGGSVVIGLVISLVCLAISATALFGYGGSSEIARLLTSVVSTYLPFVLFVVGVVLASRARTRRTGAGILIGFGAAILIAGGLCVVILIQFQTMYGR
ncbi:MAG: hypothetical protein QM779_17445 [Propionicimonas sp.]|uniref:hypothetical protein n=1 Tax=Propionicimonas sp. TaxID=1955623 RepID=UPI003D0FEC57